MLPSGSLLECGVDCFVVLVQEFSVTLDETVEEIIEGIDGEVFPVVTGDWDVATKLTIESDSLVDAFDIISLGVEDDCDMVENEVVLRLVVDIDD